MKSRVGAMNALEGRIHPAESCAAPEEPENVQAEQAGGGGAD